MSIVNENATALGYKTPVPADRGNNLDSLSASVAIGGLEEPQIGGQIGAFTIEAVIASGGMGTVFKALQRQPVQRVVALKMIRQGLSDASTRNRFFVERQTLALMDHPDIAKVYEAGTTEQGNPFFVMEYCDGQPIDQYCDQRRLPVRERVQLIIRIARAMHRAHACGVVHRDLKPANVLVSQCGDRPNLKVIDFGIAKLTDEEQFANLFGANSKHETQQGELIGTPAYMCPEQAIGQPIDARADVFAIGAILFKLLTGTTPLQVKQSTSGSLAQIIAHVSTFRAIPPSRRLSQLSAADRNAQSANLGIEFGTHLLRQCHGDLDWITLRAIEPDKLRRYATAGDLADDLQRYLDQKPVSAVAPSLLYRCNKFYQRKRAVVLASTAVTLTVAVASVIGVTQWLTTQNRQALESARIRKDVAAMLEVAEKSRVRAGKGGPDAMEDFNESQTAVAKTEILLNDRRDMAELMDRLNENRERLEMDRRSFALVAQLNDARERGTQIVGDRGDDAFGHAIGLQRVVEAFTEFGITPIEMPIEQAAELLLQCPDSVQVKLIESLDFIINEEPIGPGIYLAEKGGRVTIAQLVFGSSAYRAGILSVGDRVLSVNNSDLVGSRSTVSPRTLAYQSLVGPPKRRVRLQVARDTADPIDCELECGSELAVWAHRVLQIIDPESWRNRLRNALLNADLVELHRLANSTERETQPPCTQIQLASALFKLERSNESIRLLELAQQVHPSNFWTNHYLGTALAADHSPPLPDESLRYLTASVALRPTSLGARTNLIEGLLRVGDFGSARNHARVALKLSPDNVKLQQRFGYLLSEVALGDAPQFVKFEPAPSQAIAEQLSFAQEASLHRSSPNSVESNSITLESLNELEARARGLAAAGKRTVAFQLVREAEQRFEGNERVRRLKGIVLIELKDFAAARVVLAEVARRDPNDAEGMFYYGVALQYSGDREEAIAAYQAALRLRPDYRLVHDFLDPLLAASHP